MDPKPLVSVVVLNWNGADVLPKCLDALSAQSFRDFETLVVDNASQDGSIDTAAARWPGVKILKLEVNLGFCAGNNTGAQMARGEWLAVLNNDAFPEPDWLEHLVEAARSHPQAGIFSSQILQYHSPELVANAGDLYHISGLSWGAHRNQPSCQVNPHIHEVFSACAAAALYRRDLFLQAGGFDEDFFSHCEDTDLAFRLRLRSIPCLHVPKAVVHHLGSASFGFESEQVVYQVQRNLVWMYFKNMPTGLLLLYLPLHGLANLAMLFHYWRKGQFSAVWRAKIDALRGLPKMVRKRRLIQAQRTLGCRELSARLQHGLLAPFLLGNSGASLRQYTAKVRSVFRR